MTTLCTYMNKYKEKLSIIINQYDIVIIFPKLICISTLGANLRYKEYKRVLRAQWPLESFQECLTVFFILFFIFLVWYLCLMAYQYLWVFLTPKLSLQKYSSDRISHITGGIKVSSFPKGISPKVNIIVQLEFELAYFEATVRHFSHYTLGTSLCSFGVLCQLVYMFY